MKATLALVLLLAVPVSVSAGPIGGVWAPTPVPDLDVDKSEDDCANGPHMCAALWFLPAGTSQLLGGFGYVGWPGATLLVQLTDYADAPGLTYDGTSFTYDNGRNFASSSWGGWHQRLYRKADPLGVQYWLAIEDLPAPIYYDRNDALYGWREDYPLVPGCLVDCGPPPPPVCLVDCGPPPPPVCEVDCDPPSVPEPVSLVLLGIGLLCSRKRIAW